MRRPAALVESPYHKFVLFDAPDDETLPAYIEVWVALHLSNPLCLHYVLMMHQFDLKEQNLLLCTLYIMDTNLSYTQ